MDSSAMELPWLSPSAASLVALACDSGQSLWPKICGDPGCVLLLIRSSLSSYETCPNDSPAAHVDRAMSLRQALAHLTETRLLENPVATPIVRYSRRLAALAKRIAAATERCDPELAWSAGLLAPLGWQVAAACAPAAVQSCLQQCRASQDQSIIQQRHFGQDTAAIARRINNSWDLPNWLSAITGHLALSAEAAVSLGGHKDLFQIIQLAVHVWHRHQPEVVMACGGDTASLLQTLCLESKQIDRWCAEIAAMDDLNQVQWQAPASEPLLVHLLRLALARAETKPIQHSQRLHEEIDRLHSVLCSVEGGLTEQLHAKKMIAMAEFAAGAAHEINNPLAVISGQAQYLLGRETDMEKRQCLQKIIDQTQRVHHILTGVLQYARPAPPKKQQVLVEALLREVAEPFQKIARQRHVNLSCPANSAPVSVSIDPGHISKAVGCLLENALQAVPDQGWVKVHIELPHPDVLHIVVEDSGAGPELADTSHLFDPFFSGREAGRGMGLGLPTAWRYARLHDGDVFLDRNSTASTRFILRLPIANDLDHQNGRANGVHQHNVASLLQE